MWGRKPKLPISNADQPVCAECRHSRTETRNHDGEGERVSPYRVLVCNHPNVRPESVYRDIVTGEVAGLELQTCQCVRWQGKCGRNGAWWEAR